MVAVREGHAFRGCRLSPSVFFFLYMKSSDSSSSVEMWIKQKEADAVSMVSLFFKESGDAECARAQQLFSMYLLWKACGDHHLFSSETHSGANPSAWQQSCLIRLFWCQNRENNWSILGVSLRKQLLNLKVWPSDIWGAFKLILFTCVAFF